jgi:microcystin-dependent protein
MPSYTGRSPAYGLFEKQKIVPNGTDSVFSLDYSVGNSSSLLVAKNGLLLEPGTGGEFVVINGGKAIQFSVVPLITDEIFLVYLGKEISVSRTIGNEPIFLNFTGDGIQDTFDASPNGPLIEARLVIFVDKIFQRPGVDFTVSGSDIIFTSAPDNADEIDVYITGVERADLSLIPPIITGSKQFQQDVVIEGNLTVNGDQIIANVATLEVEDNEILLNKNYTTGVPFLDVGIRALRGDEADARLFFEETLDQWRFGTNSSLESIAPLSTVTNHISNTSNPHNVTSSQLGLGNLTNHAQLRREANDFDSFAAKTSLVNNDLVLIEDSAAAGVKKKVTAQDLATYVLTGFSSTPSGAVMPFAGSVEPSGWLFCHGQVVLQASYPTLYAVIGSTYNTGGEAINEFRLPDTRKRFLACKTDGFDIDGADILGGTGGSWLHSHTLPEHSHSMSGAGANLATGGGSAHSHGAGSYSAASGGAHTHTVTAPTKIENVGSDRIRATGSGAPANFADPFSTSSDGAHTHTITGTSATESAHTHTLTGSIGNVTSGNSGDSSLTSGTNIQSYILFNCIIKT